MINADPIHSESHIILTEIQTDEGLHRVQKLAHDIWPAYFPDIISPAQIDYMLDKYYSPPALTEKRNAGEIFSVIRKDDEDCGYLSYALNEKNFRICKLFLTEPCRGQGLAEIMLAWLVDEAWQHQTVSMDLNVNVRNTRAIRAYQKAGFETVGHETIDIGGGFVMNDYRMLKTL